MSKTDFSEARFRDDGYLSMTPEDLIGVNHRDKDNLWSILLTKLHDKELYMIEKNSTRTLFNMLANNIDFYDTDNVLDNYVQTVIENSQTGGWDNTDMTHWNELWGAALLNYIQSIDPEGIQAYEGSGVIYSDSENNIVFPELIQGGIKTTDGAALRISDIYNADAGANFSEEVLDKTNPIFYYDFTNLKVDYEHAVKEEENDYINLIHYKAVEEIEYDDWRQNYPQLRAYNDINQVYGNIDMNNRPIIEEDGYVETVLGGYEFYTFSYKMGEESEEIEKTFVIAFSYIYFDENQSFVIGDEEIRMYLENLFDKVLDEAMDNIEVIPDLAAFFNEKTLQYDREGIIIDGFLYKNIVAATSLVDTSVETIKNCYAAVLASTLHYVGIYGSIQLTEAEIEEYADKYQMDAETFEQEWQKEQLGRKNLISYTKYLSNAYFYLSKTQQALLNDWIPMTSTYSINDLRQIKFLEKAQDSYNKWIEILDSFNNFYKIKVSAVDNIDDPKSGTSCYPVIAPWVIPWYNINGKSYSTVRGTDKDIKALTNSLNLQFTQDDVDQEWIRLLMPENKRNVEVEDLNRNFWVIAQAITAISAYLFDEAGGMGKAFKDMTEAIIDMWENVDAMWAAIAALGSTPLITECKCMVIPFNVYDERPYVKYDNFDFTDPQNLNTLRAACEDKLQWITHQYRDCHLVIIPEVRFNNYRENYYSKVIYPGVYVVDRNRIMNIEFWEDLNFSTIDLSDATHKAYTYGIRERSESQYEYFAPFNAPPTDVADITYYELLRPSYEIEAEYDLSDVFTINVSISYSDAAREIATGETVTIWENGTYNTPDITATAPTNLDIVKGYYQGELLSSAVITST